MPGTSPYILDRHVTTEPGDSASFPFDRVEQNRVFEERAVAANMSVQSVKLNDWVARIVSLEGGGGSGPSGDAVMFNVLTDVGLNSIAADVEVIAVGGYANPGDAGQLLMLKRVAVEPTAHIGKKQSADGAWWEYVMPAEGIRIEWFGGIADTPSIGVGTDNLPAYNAAEVFITSHYSNAHSSFAAYKGGPKILFGYGGKNADLAGYYFSGPLTPTRTIHLKGASAGGARSNFGHASKLYFAAGVQGIVLPGTAGVFPAMDPSAAWSCIEDLSLYCLGFGGQTTMHGIQANCQVVLRNVRVEGFGGDGVRVEAFAPATNANLSYLEGVRCSSNAGNGFYFEGPDANACVCTGLDASANGGWGIFDSSFLGNTFIGCHTATNALGGYKTDNANAYAVFIGCYSEGETSSVIAPSLIFGGLLGSFAINDSSAQTFTNNRQRPFSIANTSASNDLTISFNTTDNGLFDLGGIDASGFEYKFLYSAFYGNFIWSHQGDPDALHITTDSTTITAGRSALPSNSMVFPSGLWIGQGSTAVTTAPRQIRISNAAPTSGENAWGDIVYYRDPVPGAALGWVCTAAGTPGTWTLFGNSLLEASETHDPVSLATGAVTAIDTIALTGAALGDLVDASFSLNLQGVRLNAWVSAANVVSYQFFNPTAGVIDLGSGTVKCRVRK
jgi:hypothetical protein